MNECKHMIIVFNACFLKNFLVRPYFSNTLFPALSLSSVLESLNLREIQLHVNCQGQVGATPLSK